MPQSATGHALIESFVLKWHLEHYDMESDIEARDQDPSVQHLNFLYGVRRGSLAAWVP